MAGDIGTGSAHGSATTEERQSENAPQHQEPRDLSSPADTGTTDIETTDIGTTDAGTTDTAELRDALPSDAGQRQDTGGSSAPDNEPKSWWTRTWAMVVGLGVLVGIAAGIAQLWDSFGKDTPPAARTGVAAGTVTAPAAAPSCWRSAPRRTDRPDFAVCVSSNVEVNDRGEVRAFPGAWILVNVEVVNTGSAQLDNVVVRTQLDRGLTIDRDSAFLTWSGKPGGVPLGASATDALSDPGVNIGSYASNGNGYLSFYVKVGASDEFDCGTSRRVVSAHAETAGKAKGSDMVVAVVRQC